MYIILSIFAVVSLTAYLTVSQDKFGELPQGDRLNRILQSPNFTDGSFKNQSFTPDLAEDVSMVKVINDGLFHRSKRLKPAQVLPSVKTNLKSLAPDDLLVWFGHSSYFLQLSGKTVLVDPVFSGNASPFSFSIKSFAGADVYSPDDLPDIDYLFITHDHWDHLDYETVMTLKPRIGRIFTGLGTGEHLEKWGFDPEKITELDWNEKFIPEEGFEIHATPARHFSGRGFKRNQALWSSFVLKSTERKIYIGGDSGYDTHFGEIGKVHGPFDLALLECGQYNSSWKYIHMMPEETVQAAIDLNARTMMPVHWGKFALALHDWDEPVLRVTREANRLRIPIIHPMIGQLTLLDNFGPQTEWWAGLD